LEEQFCQSPCVSPPSLFREKFSTKNLDTMAQRVLIANYFHLFDQCHERDTAVELQSKDQQLTHILKEEGKARLLFDAVQASQIGGENPVASMIAFVLHQYNSLLEAHSLNLEEVRHDTFAVLDKAVEFKQRVKLVMKKISRNKIIKCSFTRLLQDLDIMPPACEGSYLPDLILLEMLEL